MSNVEKPKKAVEGTIDAVLWMPHMSKKAAKTYTVLRGKAV